MGHDYLYILFSLFYFMGLSHQFWFSSTVAKLIGLDWGIKLTPTQESGPTGCIGWRAGTTTLCRS